MMRAPLELALALGALAPLGPAQSLVHSLPGTTTGDHYGYRVAVLGDVDGDGHDDFLVSAPGWSGQAGLVELRSGLSGSLIGSVQGAAGDHFGLSLAVLGDVDADTVDDFAVGAPQRGTRGSGFGGAPVGAGYVRVFSGATLTPIRTHGGTSLGDAYGHSIHGGLDADGDGLGDLAIGAPVASGAELRSGGSGGLLQTIASFGPETGYTVALASDLDGDLLADPLVAMLQGFSGFSSEVRGYGGVSGSLLWAAFSGIGGELGWAILPTDDVDSDGTADVILADREWGNSLGALGHGRLYWVSGASGSTLAVEAGPSPALGVAFGMGLAHLGDLDGDGLRDLAIATPGVYEWDGSAYPGQALRFTHGYPVSVVNELAPPGVSATFAQALAAGLLDADNIVDLVVGSPRDDGGQPGSGVVRVYSYLTDPQVYCTSQANSQGCLPRIWWTGTPSAAASTLRVRAADVLSKKFGVLFWGPGPAQLPFGGGTLCVGSPVKRTAAQFSGGNPPPEDCSGIFSYQFTSAYLSAEGLTPGTTVFSQYWSRDPAHASGFNVSDAVYFTVLP